MSGRACSCTQTDDTFSAAAALNTPAASAATSGAPTTAAPAAAPAAAAAATTAAAAAASPNAFSWGSGRRCLFEASVSVEVTDGSAHNTLYASGAQARPHHVPIIPR